VDWSRVADRAKQIIDKRGGTQSVKEDAEELKDIARGQGTTEAKVKQAIGALREPGAHREGASAPPPGTSAAHPADSEGDE
jgi:hypothetical protein